MDKICVYTCITGNYDKVIEIPNKEPGIDYYLFTNNQNIKSKSWEVVYIKDDTIDDQRLSRKIKMLGHPMINEKYDILVWQDACVVFKKSIKEFVETYLKDYPFASFKHSERDCIYEEAKACVSLRKDKKEIIQKQIEFYKENNYPEHYGLYEMTVFIKRPKDPTVIKTMQMWFDMVCKWSKRDQLSFMWCVYNTKLLISPINESVWNNEWFTWIGHNSPNITGYSVIYDDALDIYKQDQGEYVIDKNTYSASIVVPFDCNKVKINTFIPSGYIIDDIEVTSDKNIDVIYDNTIEINDKIMTKDRLKIKINSPLKENDKINVSFSISRLDYEELIQEFITLNEKVKYSELVNKMYEEELSNMVNSTSWKVTKPIREIKSKLGGTKHGK